MLSLRKGHVVRFHPSQIKILVNCLSVFEGNIPVGSFEVYENENAFGLRSTDILRDGKKFYVEIDKETLEYRKGREDCFMFLRCFLFNLSEVKGITVNNMKFLMPLERNVNGTAIYDGDAGFDVILED